MPHLTNRLTATVVDILDFAPFSCVPLSFATDRRLLRLFRRHPLPHRSSNHAAVMFIKTGNSRNAARVAILPACCYRTRIFIAGEMSRSDRALDDARCSADRRSSELDGNVNERARSWLLPIFTSPKIFPPPPPLPFDPSSRIPISSSFGRRSSRRTRNTKCRGNTRKFASLVIHARWKKKGGTN